MAGGIVITGSGIICALGAGKDAVGEALLDGRRGIGTMRFLQSSHRNLPVGEVPYTNDELKHSLSILTEGGISRTLLLGITAVREALEDAVVPYDGRCIVLVSGTTVAGMDLTERHYKEMVSTGRGAYCLRQHDCGSDTAGIAAYFGIFSDCTTVSTACSSAANAIMLGADMLKAGEADVVVAGGTEALSAFHLGGFNSLMILDDEPCRPFDKTRKGLNLGEGAAYVVMERADSAGQRGAKPKAWLTGYGNACDAFHQTASSPEGYGAQLAMRQALEMAGLQPEDIQWIHAHGTGTPNNDSSESRAIASVFSDGIPAVSSTKGFTGHTTSAAGAIASVISIIAMHRHFIPANLGWRHPADDCIRPAMGKEKVQLHNVMVNAFGFGGNDSSLVLSDSPSATKPGLSYGGADIEQLSKVENDSLDALGEIRKFVRPMEARRMGKLLKSSLLTSMQALEKAGVAVPDAIVTGTEWGSVENTEKLLMQLTGGDGELSPTLFMQSTHNVIGSNIAIHLKCHGFNTTIVQGGRSLEWAVCQAKLLLMSGKCRTVLVGCHDESTPLFNSLLKSIGREERPMVHSVAMVLKRK